MKTIKNERHVCVCVRISLTKEGEKNRKNCNRFFVIDAYYEFRTDDYQIIENYVTLKDFRLLIRICRYFTPEKTLS